MSYLVCCIVLLSVFSYNDHIVFSSPTTYDQRQNGDINVQIHLKDVQVVALLDTDLLDDYTDYDYPYDYADFTLKPIIKPTTITSTVSTITASSVTNADNRQTTKPATSDPTQTTATPNILVTEVSQFNTTEGASVSNDDVFTIDEEKKIIAETASASNSKESCPPLYVFDKKQGRCRTIKNRRRYSLVPLNLRLGSRPMRKRQGQDGRLVERTKDLPIRIYKSEPIKQSSLLQ